MIKRRTVILTAAAVILWAAPISTVIWYVATPAIVTTDERVLLNALLGLAMVVTLVRVFHRPDHRVDERMTLLAMRIGAQVAEQTRSEQDGQEEESKRGDEGPALRAL